MMVAGLFNTEQELATLGTYGMGKLGSRFARLLSPAAYVTGKLGCLTWLRLLLSPSFFVPPN